MFAYLVINFPLGASIKLFFVGYCAAGHSNRYNTAVARSKRTPLCGLESGVSLCVCGLCVPLCFIVVPFVEWVRAVCARLGGKVVAVEGLTDVLGDKRKNS